MGVARGAPGSGGITAPVVEAGSMDTGTEPPDPETLKAPVSSLSLQRVGRTEEVAASICFLASPAPSYVTGTVGTPAAATRPEPRRQPRGAAPGRARPGTPHAWRPRIDYAYN